MPSSALDLTGCASEDEVRQSQRHPQSPRNNCTTVTLNPIQSAVVPYLPSPLDLYNSFTPLSLIQLPFVSIVFILLQLPLHYKSTVINDDTIHYLNENEWCERIKTVKKMSVDLCRIEKEVGRQQNSQKMVRSEVMDLKRRLGKLKEKREMREEWVRVHGIPSMNIVEGKKNE